MLIEISDRELAQILAALRNWQIDSLNEDMTQWGREYSFKVFNDGEIDAFCARMNTQSSIICDCCWAAGCECGGHSLIIEPEPGLTPSGPDHDDECITICPIPAGQKCRIGHHCWCTEGGH